MIFTLVKFVLCFKFNFFRQTCISSCGENTEAPIEQNNEKK